MPEIDTVVLVEGVSDQVAIEALATRLDRDLPFEGVSLVPMGGAGGFGDFLEKELDRHGSEIRLAGLCDVGEVSDMRRGLRRVGIGSDLSLSEMESLGFFVCDEDLEDELIRCLGVAHVENVIEEQGDLASLRSLQNQPAWRGREPHEQLRRFMGSQSGRKARYGRLMVEKLDLGLVPRPLRMLLAHI